MKSYVTYKQPDLASSIEIGVKATNLFLLQKCGFNVPKWMVITSITTRKINSIRSNSEISDIKISLENQIQELFPNVKYFAVRSSSINEDKAEASFAGQYESYLFVPKHLVFEKVMLVVQSANSERVKLYSDISNATFQAEIAVIIQEMVVADVSGVAFGINPVTGNRNEKIINAVFGLGEGLVAGKLCSDKFSVLNKIISREIIKKNQQITLNPDNNVGTYLTDVSDNIQNLPTLSDKQIIEIESVLDKIFLQTGKYQDIEFSYKNETLYLLQTRPITNLHKIEDTRGKYIVWDNSNIIESYPGITGPLTFSFILDVYETAYKQLLELFGVKNTTILENQIYFKNMLGLINGRVYYNLRSWYKILSLLPGYSINSRFMEKMMGVKEKFELDDYCKKSKFADYFDVVSMIVGILRNLKTLRNQIKTFEKNFVEVDGYFKTINFNLMSADQIMQVFHYLEKNLLNRWKAPLVNDFFAMIYFGVLQKITAKLSDGNNMLHNDLLIGSKDIISIEPTKLLSEIIQLILQNKTYNDLFINNSIGQIYDQNNKEKYEPLFRLIKKYLENWGDRFVAELKLETITYKQNPLAFIVFLKSHLNQYTSRTKPDINNIRKDAEKLLNQSFKYNPLKKLIFQHVLNQTRKLVSNRENLRLYRTKAFAMVRQVFLQIGKQFYAEGIILHSRDIFYLSKSEIFDYIKGTSINKELKQIIRLRKSENKEFLKQKPFGERITSKGIVYQGNNFYPKNSKVLSDGNLKGTGCCRGFVRAKVRIVIDPSEISSLNGEILVTSSTDPGWVTLFPSASGILVERGSLLSHSAIVSREMGIPCIVGISGLLDSLKNGDTVEMDGSSGIVRIISI